MSGFDYPLLLEPVNVPRPWGGGQVCRLYDRPCVESEEPIGETWDVSTWPRDPGNAALATVTRIVNGPLAGTPLDRVTHMPVVVKLLDSAEKLSVQAHPVSPDAHKDEMWYILHAEPGAYLYCGLAPGAELNEFCELVRSPSPDEDRVLGMLKRESNLRPGMHFNVPTGTVHAVGPGLVAFEVSERAQITYRLYDYNRGRALQLDEGCRAVVAVRPALPVLQPGMKIQADDVETLTKFPTFDVLRVRGSRISVICAKHSHLVTATMGDCRISGPDPNWDIKLRHSFTCVVPGGYRPYEIDAGAGGEALITPLRS